MKNCCACYLVLITSRFVITLKQNVYSQQRSHVIIQVWITFILYVIVSASCAYSYCSGMWKCTVYTYVYTVYCVYRIALQILRTAMNKFMIY
jgi:hypothetical protein